MRTIVPMTTAFIVVLSTVLIIVPFGIFMTGLTEISRDTIIIQGPTIMATVIGVGSRWAMRRPRERERL
jgi:hypothetical protein